MSDETERLSRAMSAGDRDAVEAFYRRYFDWLYAQTRQLCRRDESFCLDVVQEAVLRIVRTIRPVRFEAQLRAWMKLVLQTTALDLMRSEKRRRNRELVAVAARSESQPETDDADQQEWLKRQIARFDPAIVRMIELRYEKRWKLSKIAQLLGLSVGTIDGRIRRALKELRNRAIEEFDE